MNGDQLGLEEDLAATFPPCELFGVKEYDDPNRRTTGFVGELTDTVVVGDGNPSFFSSRGESLRSFWLLGNVQGDAEFITTRHLELRYKGRIALVLTDQALRATLTGGGLEIGATGSRQSQARDLRGGTDEKSPSEVLAFSWPLTQIELVAVSKGGLADPTELSIENETEKAFARAFDVNQADDGFRARGIGLRTRAAKLHDEIVKLIRSAESERPDHEQRIARPLEDPSMRRGDLGTRFSARAS